MYQTTPLIPQTYTTLYTYVNYILIKRIVLSYNIWSDSGNQFWSGSLKFIFNEGTISDKAGGGERILTITDQSLNNISLVNQQVWRLSATSDLLSFKYDLNSPETLLVVLQQAISHDCSWAHLHCHEARSHCLPRINSHYHVQTLIILKMQVL